jgi:hypothetical protein
MRTTSFPTRLLVIAAVLLPATMVRAAAPITQSKAADGATVTFSVAPPSPTTAEVVRLTVRAVVDASLDLGPVAIDAALPEGWRLLDADTAPVRIASDGKRIVERTYRLEPFLPGDVQIKPIAVSLRPLVSSDKASSGPVVTSDPISLTVRSVLQTEGEATPAEIRPIVDPPFAMPAWGWGVLAGVAAAGVLLALALVAIARRARLLKLVRLTAHQRAFDSLDRLAVDDLPAHGEFKTFHQRLSDILRTYIEDRFGLHAPDRTTEEFLAEARTSHALSVGDVTLLEQFLTRCDMVKFAAMTPDRSSAEVSVETVRAFIDRTRTDELQLVIDPGSGEHRRAEDVPELLIAAGLLKPPEKQGGAA